VQDLFLYPLEGKPFEPGIGSGPSRTVSVKFIFATNVEPEKLVEQNRFRHDVLARLVTRIDIPPLRSRKEDIPVLVDHFLGGLSEEIGHEISVVSPKAMNLLCRRSYQQGNVRELRSELQQAISKAALENDRTLRAGYLSRNTRGPMSGAQPHSDVPEPDTSAEIRLQDSSELEVLRRHGFQIASAENDLGYSHKSKTLSNHLRGMCIQALAEVEWDLDLAASNLAGDGETPTKEKLKAKMNRYLSRIDEYTKSGTEKKLFNNLPAAYHGALRLTIEQFRP
jgi:transcriptional regulator with GAF, ATPase, and Fis domain